VSEHSGVPGKTPWQAARAQRAAERKTAYEARTVEEQLVLLDSRPGASKRERKRLERANE
jgi:hypothetical protein